MSQETITERENPASLAKFCANDDTPPGYHNCPIWRRHRDAEREGKGKQLQREIDRTAPDLQRAPVAL